MANTRLFKQCRCEEQQWDSVRVVFYVGDSTHDVVVTPREALKEGVNLYEGVDLSGGWTSFGNAYVEAVEGDTVKTTVGDLTPDHGMCIEKPNVMPYTDGEICLNLFSHTSKVYLPEGETVVMDTYQCRKFINGQIEGLKALVEAIEAQHPGNDALVAPYKAELESLQKFTDWRELQLVFDSDGNKDMPPFRIEASFGKGTLMNLKDFQYEDEAFLSYSREFCGARCWDLYEKLPDGTLKPKEYKNSISNVLSCLTGGLLIRRIHNSLIDFRDFSLYTGFSEEVKEPHGTLCLYLSETSSPKKTVVRKLIDRLMATTDREEMEYVYDKMKYGVTDSADNELEVAMFLTSPKGEVKAAEYKKLTGNNAPNGEAMLKSLRNKRGDIGPEAAIVYARLLKRKGVDNSEIEKAYDFAINHCTNPEKAEKLKEEKALQGR